ncbi:MAG: hypothetical protein PHH75_01560 [Candidatus Omnitrophica bacterium]|nr:hypothetical protein [Candidatus Omnitrophota bacterium]MDD5573846.1 hypothetical protein [Candidatus Omnitrophota bacterium]
MKKIKSYDILLFYNFSLGCQITASGVRGTENFMLKEYKAQALMSVWGGFLFGALGYVVTYLGSPHGYFGYVMMTGGYVLLACGGYMYARGKGYGWVMGLLGILGPVGLLILYVLRDKSALILRKRRKEGLA